LAQVFGVNFGEIFYFFPLSRTKFFFKAIAGQKQPAE